jgi:hypothetical protein
MSDVEHVFLSRRNLLTLLNKLDRKFEGDTTTLCTIIKKDNRHEKYPQSCPMIVVTAIEDVEYYVSRGAGEVHPLDNPETKNAT